MSGFWFIFWLGDILLVLSVLPKLLLLKKKPSATLAWLWALLLFPYVGVLLFWLIGTERIHWEPFRWAGREGERKEEINALMEHLSQREKRLFQMVERLTGFSASATGNVRMFTGGKAFYEALLERIRNARHSVHIEIFIWRKDAWGQNILDELLAACRRGVRVRVLVDQWGDSELTGEDFKPLVSAGGKFAWFSSLVRMRKNFFLNLRNHRKLQVIDGQFAFVGGMNIGREYAGEGLGRGQWYDAQLELRGPVVGQLQECFADDWFFAAGEKLEEEMYFNSASQLSEFPIQVIRAGPSSDGEPIHKTMVTLLNEAEERAWLCAGYFVPSDALLLSLQLCALRGVDTRIITSRKSDHQYLLPATRSYYDCLLPYGVRIYEFAEESGVYHAKMVLVDESWVLMGSANADRRSLKLNFELNVLAYSKALTHEWGRIVKEDFQRCEEIDWQHFQRRPFGQRLVEGGARLLSPLL